MNDVQRDTAHCRALLTQGSKSFAFAGALLPRHVLDEAAAIYAFCREADDAIDEAPSAQAAREAHAALQHRLTRIARAPSPSSLADPVDRALKRVIVHHTLPLWPLTFLLDGFLWDAEGRVYEKWQDTLEYAARVAGSVGVLMARLCGCEDPHVLARAADMGVAMQLVNIARDVGEDARRQRLYLPRTWLLRQGLSPEDFLLHPAHHPAITAATERSLQWADALFARARLALYALPWYARWSFAAAGRIYQDIGRTLRRTQYDNITGRAQVTFSRKLWLATFAMASDGWRPRTIGLRTRLRRPALMANAPLIAPQPFLPNSAVEG